MKTSWGNSRIKSIRFHMRSNDRIKGKDLNCINQSILNEFWRLRIQLKDSKMKGFKALWCRDRMKYMNLLWSEKNMICLYMTWMIKWGSWRKRLIWWIERIRRKLTIWNDLRWDQEGVWLRWTDQWLMRFTLKISMRCRMSSEKLGEWYKRKITLSMRFKLIRL